MHEAMTVAEIEAKYDSEWVLIEDVETDENLQILGGKVLWHSKDRDEIDRKMLELRPRSCATLYTGEPPKGMEYAVSVWTHSP